MKIAKTSQLIRQQSGSVRKPGVALVLPYDPKMMPKQEIDQRLTRMLGDAERRLLAAHPAETAMPVVRKLQQVVRRLNSSTLKVGIAVFVSEEVAKVSYLNFPVEERVLIDEPFRIRDIADCRPESKEFLVLVLSAKESKMYLHTEGGLKLIKSNTPQNVYAYLNEVPERAANFCDPENRREVVLNKFLHHMDEGLGAVLKVYPLPVFVVGTERVLGHFSKLTRHDPNIAGWLGKQGLDIPEPELEQMLKPLLDNWRETLEQILVKQMENAARAGKLVCGLHEARKAAGCRNSRVIIVERFEEADGDRCFYTDGEIDLLVEKVLESGGVVEKMDKARLGSWGPVALIKYY